MVYHAAGGGMIPSVAQNIVTSRLLVLQSKRLMLKSLERRASGDVVRPLDGVEERLRKVRGDIERADATYQRVILSLGEPSDGEFWLIAYRALIEKASALVERMRGATVALPAAERFAAAADVEMLEELVGSWQDAIRSGIVKGAA